MRQLIGLLLAVFLVGCGLPAVPPPFLENGASFDGVTALFSRRPSRMLDRVGNGFFISADGCLLTAYHTIEASLLTGADLSVDPGYASREVRLLAALPGRDLALLKAEGAARTPALRITQTVYMPRQGEKFLVLSRPGTAAEAEVTGEIGSVFRSPARAGLLPTASPVFSYQLDLSVRALLLSRSFLDRVFPQLAECDSRL